MVSLYMVFPGSILLTGAFTYASVVGTRAAFAEVLETLQKHTKFTCI